MDDRMGIEEGLELKDSALWSRVCKELDYRLGLTMAELRHCSTEQLTVIQNRLDILEEVKRLPQDVIEREST